MGAAQTKANGEPRDSWAKLLDPTGLVFQPISWEPTPDPAAPQGGYDALPELSLDVGDAEDGSCVGDAASGGLRTPEVAAVVRKIRWQEVEAEGAPASPAAKLRKRPSQVVREDMLVGLEVDGGSKGNEISRTSSASSSASRRRM